MAISREERNRQILMARDLSGYTTLTDEQMKRRMSSTEMQFTKLPEGYVFQVATKLGVAPIKYIIAKKTW